jgi:hypothetical protein
MFYDWEGQASFCKGDKNHSEECLVTQDRYPPLPWTSTFSIELKSQVAAFFSSKVKSSNQSQYMY